MPARRWNIHLVALLLLLIGVQVLSALPARAAAESIQLGAYTPYAPGDANVLDEYANIVGRKPDIVLFYKDFFAPLMTGEQAANLKARGETPMVTWEPDQPTSGFPAANLADIASGRYDSYIEQAARLVREYSSEVMIRFGHEMNISASLWGPGKDGNVGSTFVEAWRHIVTIFRQEGATNAKWVWGPNVDWGGVPFEQYFPGDSWVDYVGLDGYNWGTYGTEIWQSMSRLFSSSYKTITQMSSKPVIFAETSSGEVGGSKAEWIREGFLHTIPENFPRVHAVIWFNAVSEEDWRISTSASALQAYREVAASSLYGGSNPAPSVTPTEEGSELKSLAVTPSTVSSGSSKTRGHHPKVVYKVTRRAPMRFVIRRKKGRKVWGGRYVTEITNKRRTGSVDVSRLLGGRSPRRGTYLITASVVGSQGISSSRQTIFKVLSGATAGAAPSIGLDGIQPASS